MRTLKAGKVYFVSAPGRIKIGWTARPEQRLKQLQSMDMEKLTCLGTIDGTRELERHLHGLLADLNFHGEWFTDCEQVRSIVDAALRGEIQLPPPEPVVLKRRPNWDFINFNFQSAMGDWMPDRFLGALHAELEMFKQLGLKEKPGRTWHILECKHPHDWETYMAMVNHHAAAVPAFKALRDANDVDGAHALIERMEKELAEINASFSSNVVGFKRG